MQKTAHVGSVMESLESRRLLHGFGAELALGVFGLGGEGDVFHAASTNPAIKADLTQIRTDSKTLGTDLKALTAAQKTTLQTDLKAIRTAVKTALGTTAVKTLETKLQTDTVSARTTIFNDLKAIRADAGNATKLAADKTMLAADEKAADNTLDADQAAIVTAINNDAGVKAAKATLATDLPTIAKDLNTLQADKTKLHSDIETNEAATGNYGLVDIGGFGFGDHFGGHH
jgi:chromosome segregation ATPase